MPAPHLAGAGAWSDCAVMPPVAWHRLPVAASVTSCRREATKDRVSRVSQQTPENLCFLPQCRDVSVEGFLSTLELTVFIPGPGTNQGNQYVHA